MKKRASDEVLQELAKVSAAADALKTKYAETDMPPEEVEALEALVAQMEQLASEKQEAEASERMAHVRSKMSEPARPAPRVSARTREQALPSLGEAFGLWLSGDHTPDAAYKCRSLGADVGSRSFNMPINYDRVNFKKRTALSKGGTGTGLEYVWQGYSDKVVEYLTFFSPVLGLVDTETTSDGNKRTYFIVDDTSMESTYITASGGTETNPTIPATNLVTANKVLSTFDITSGVQQITMQELRDSFVSLEDKVAKASANSHARKIERDLFTATGNGLTGVEGIASVATSAGTPSAWTQDTVLAALTAIPPQYRKDAIFAANDTTKQAINVALRDDIGRSLFDRQIEDDVEFDTLFGKKFNVSQFIAADTLYCFVPSFYKLRMVSGQVLQQFVERYWPNVGWASLVSFGGGWVGPATAVQKVVKT